MPWIIHPNGRRELVNPTLEEQIAFAKDLADDLVLQAPARRAAGGRNGTPARESASGQGAHGEEDPACRGKKDKAPPRKAG